jgi:sugar (pentulose or hexulose) kinase
MAKLLGIDIGTTGTRAVLLDVGGRVLNSASAESESLCPRCSWHWRVPRKHTAIRQAEPLCRDR